jgi:biotin synthase
MSKNLRSFSDLWAELGDLWTNEQMDAQPLSPGSPRLRQVEAKLAQPVISLLSADNAEAEELFASARRVRDSRIGPTIDLRAVIDLGNKCRVNCSFCPMRRDNSHALPPSRAKANQIVAATEEAYALGFRHLFLQSGEDVTIIRQVTDALRLIRESHKDCHFVLNLGSHRSAVYARLKAAGAHGYLIKHETANATLHQSLRGETLEKRIHHTLLARAAGLYIGSGNILGLPGQTDLDLVRDLIFLGRINSSRMVSCAPFTPSDDLPAGFQRSEPGIFEKTLRFIALLRHAFPNARIPATSNLDSPALIRPKGLDKSGQAMAIEAGANGITVQFTPREIEDDYGLYVRGSDKRKQGFLVGIEKAKRVSEETGLPLALVNARSTRRSLDRRVRGAA